MKIFHTICLFTLVAAAHSIDELFNSFLRTCRPSRELGIEFFLKYRFFLKAFDAGSTHMCTTSTLGEEICRDLEATGFWNLLTMREPKVLELLELSRKVALKMKSTSPPMSEECGEWLGRFLGDQNFTYSYLELLCKSVPFRFLRPEQRLTELTHGNMIRTLTEFKRMHLEREHLFNSRDEELYDIHSLALFLYAHLVDHRVGLAIRSSIQDCSFSLTYVFFAKEIFLLPADRKQDMNFAFLFRYINYERDFIQIGSRRTLRRSTNFSRVFTVWGDFIKLLPVKADRQWYFDEEQDLETNVKLIHLHARNLKKNQWDCIKWGKKVMMSIAIAFDLVEALASYEKRRESVMHIKLMLIDSLRKYSKMKSKS